MLQVVYYTQTYNKNTLEGNKLWRESQDSCFKKPYGNCIRLNSLPQKFLSTQKLTI